jgi:hypothetical protein
VPDTEVGEELANMTKRKPNLRTVRELTPTLEYRTIHGYRRAFRVAGTGPAILLIHGIGDNSTTWQTVRRVLIGGLLVGRETAQDLVADVGARPELGDELRDLRLSASFRSLSRGGSRG